MLTKLLPKIRTLSLVSAHPQRKQRSSLPTVSYMPYNGTMEYNEYVKMKSVDEYFGSEKRFRGNYPAGHNIHSYASFYWLLITQLMNADCFF